MSKVTVHIFSVIPKLSDILAKCLPEISLNTVNIKESISLKYEKIVTEEELLQLKNAKIILGDGNLISQIYDKLPNTEWVQLTWAGFEKMASRIRERSKPNYLITRMGSQAFSQLMAEYTVGWVLNSERGWLDAAQYQKQSTWAHKDNIASYRSLRDLTVGVLGTGLIGSEIIRSLKFFNCQVIALGKRGTPPEGIHFDRYYSVNDLPCLLQESDYVVNALPSTPDTKGLLGGNTLQSAKRRPVLINIGRGDIISERDIINALDKSWISAAVLDVFEQEPLPKASPLWLHPKVNITPHAAGVSRAEDVVESFVINLKRFLEGKPLLNVIDWEKGY